MSQILEYDVTIKHKSRKLDALSRAPVVDENKDNYKL